MNPIRALSDALQSKFQSALRLLRDPQQVIGVFAVFSQLTTERVNPANPKVWDRFVKRSGLTLRKLEDEETLGLGGVSKEFEQSVEEFQNLGYNGAYGIFSQGRLAGVIWIIPEKFGQGRRLLDMREDEAEIGLMLTLPEFRGRGVMPFAMDKVIETAREMGVRRWFSVVAAHNQRSLRMSGKMGFQRVGYMVRISLPRSLGGFRWVYRGYRRGLQPPQGP